MFLFWILKALALSLIYAKTQTPTYSVKKYSSRISAIFFSVYYLKLICEFSGNHRLPLWMFQQCQTWTFNFEVVKNDRHSLWIIEVSEYDIKKPMQQ